MTKFVQFLKDESGASAAEYALILGILGAGIATGIVTLRGHIQTAVDKANTAMVAAEAANP